MAAMQDEDEGYGKRFPDLVKVELDSPEDMTVLGVVVQEKKTLLIYEKTVPGTDVLSDDKALHYASVQHPKDVLCLPSCYVSMCRPRDEAYKITNLLDRCAHRNILKVNADFEENRDGIWFGHITFPMLDEALSQVAEDKLFHLKADSEGKKWLQGFTKQGLKAFRDIVDAVKHVNDMYDLVGTSSGGGGQPVVLLPLQLGVDRILCQHLKSGEEYNVLLGDFYGRNDFEKFGLSKCSNARELQRLNWKGVGDYLSTLTDSYGHNVEFAQLIGVLKGQSVDEVLWESALWDAKTRMHFIREVAFCMDVDTSGKRKEELKGKSALGLQGCIDKLGSVNDKTQVKLKDGNLFELITFLRNKILAHYDDTHDTYSGPKEDIGMDKESINNFLLKEKPDYMIKLMKAIRKLKWIQESPLSRENGDDYMQQFKT